MGSDTPRTVPALVLAAAERFGSALALRDEITATRTDHPATYDFADLADAALRASAGEVVTPAVRSAAVSNITT